MDLKFVIKQAGDALRLSELYRFSHLVSMWNGIQFVEHKQMLVNTDAELSRDGRKINLYPVLLRRPASEANHALLREFGQMLFMKASPDLQKRWKKKMVLPSKAQIDAFQSKLHSKKFKCYKDLVEDFSCPCDRLVAVNLSNAFLANHQPIQDSYNTDIRKYGPTCLYSNLKRYHSAIPLVSAYAPRRIFEDFGEAFADLVVHKLRNVRHTSVQAVVKDLVFDLVAATR